MNNDREHKLKLAKAKAKAIKIKLLLNGGKKRIDDFGKKMVGAKKDRYAKNASTKATKHESNKTEIDFSITEKPKFFKGTFQKIGDYTLFYSKDFPKADFNLMLKNSDQKSYKAEVAFMKHIYSYLIRKKMWYSGEQSLVWLLKFVYENGMSYLDNAVQNNDNSFGFALVFDYDEMPLSANSFQFISKEQYKNAIDIKYDKFVENRFLFKSDNYYKTELDEIEKAYYLYLIYKNCNEDVPLSFVKGFSFFEYTNTAYLSCDLCNDFSFFRGSFDYVDNLIEYVNEKYAEKSGLLTKKKERKPRILLLNNGNIIATYKKNKRSIRQSDYVVLRTQAELGLSYSEMHKYLEEHYKELEEEGQKRLQRFDEKSGANSERTGKDYRNGKNASESDFLDYFGFRGVEFGNYVNQKERAKHLNQTYDSLRDLCEIINISPSCISLGGRLGISFGSRGQSKASAHYEPSNLVINLTKGKGAGSLAHEWFHALDHYFAYNFLGANKMTSHNKYKTDYGTNRSAIGDAFNTLKTEIIARISTNTAYADRCFRCMKQWGEYWGRHEEMFARAFEAYIIWRLDYKGIKNDYLANIPTVEKWLADYGSIEFYPYPIFYNSGSYSTVDLSESDKQRSCNADNKIFYAFDNLFAELNERVNKETNKMELYGTEE